VDVIFTEFPLSLCCYFANMLQNALYELNEWNASLRCEMDSVVICTVKFLSVEREYVAK